MRNFGLVWVGGRSPGAELELALRARRLWEQMAGSVAGVSLRPAGSLTVALEEAELQLMKDACARDDAVSRQWELLDPLQASEANPELSEAVLGALYCKADAIVEPRFVLSAMREALLRQRGRGRYTWLPGRTAVELASGSVRDDTGDWHSADRVFLCTGAAHAGLVRPYLPPGSLRRVRLQMLETAAYPGTIATALADGDSMRYYPAFDLPGRTALAAQSPEAAASRAQLLLVQRLDGSLTIGDTHEYEEPFGFDVEEPAYEHLVERAEAILRKPLPSVLRRWAGVYSEVGPHSPVEAVYWRQEVLPGVELVTGPGGRGMTCAPAIAEDSFSVGCPVPSTG